MADAHVTLEGLEWLLALLDTLGKPERFMDEPTRQALGMIAERARTYPGEPAGSRYERTFNLQDSWEPIYTLSGGELGRVRSGGLNYNRYVMDAEYQAAIHAGRWTTVQEIAAELENPIAELYEKALQMLIDKRGISV